MRVAAWQAPIPTADRGEALGLLRAQVDRCEADGVRILCCPEGILGGLADYAHDPSAIALDVETGALVAALAPLASDTVSLIVGFTETGTSGELFNAAAIYHRGRVTGVYRKLFPAIRRSVYRAGKRMPVFAIEGLTFGVLICRDSTFPVAARTMASSGAKVLFVPSNNGLPLGREEADLFEATRETDAARATENGVWVVRADVAGRGETLWSHGTSGIVDPTGSLLAGAEPFRPGLLVADVGP